MGAWGRVKPRSPGEGMSGNRDTKITKTDNKNSDKKTVTPVNDGHSKGISDKVEVCASKKLQFRDKGERSLEAATRRTKE